MEILLLLLWVVCGIAAGAIASNKGKSGCAWFALGFLFGPIALAFAFGIESGQCPRCRREIAVDATRCPSCQADLRAPPPPVAIARKTKDCPYCAETIMAAAVKCRFCGESLPVVVSAPPADLIDPSDYEPQIVRASEAKKTSSSAVSWVMAIVGVGVVVYGLYFLTENHETRTRRMLVSKSCFCVSVTSGSKWPLSADTEVIAEDSTGNERTIVVATGESSGIRCRIGSDLLKEPN